MPCTMCRVCVCHAAPLDAAPRAPVVLLGTLPAVLGWQELATRGRGGFSHVFKLVLTFLSPTQSLIRGLGASHRG